MYTLSIYKRGILPIVREISHANFLISPDLFTGPSSLLIGQNKPTKCKTALQWKISTVVWTKENEPKAKLVLTQGSCIIITHQSSDPKLCPRGILFCQHTMTQHRLHFKWTSDQMSLSIP